MESTILILLVFIIAALFILGVAVVFLYLKSRSPKKEVSIHSTIEGFRAIGELSVFKVFTKEIAAQIDHSWGDFGKKYLDWIYSSK